MLVMYECLTRRETERHRETERDSLMTPCDWTHDPRTGCWWENPRRIDDLEGEAEAQRRRARKRDGRERHSDRECERGAQ